MVENKDDGFVKWNVLDADYFHASEVDTQGEPEKGDNDSANHSVIIRWSVAVCQSALVSSLCG
jgi:hypothetical protein